MSQPKITIFRTEEQQKKLDQLFVASEINPANPFEMEVWAQIERIYTEMPPPAAVPLRLVGKHIQCRAAYEGLQKEPTPERLELLKAALDDFLPAFEKDYGSKWDR